MTYNILCIDGGGIRGAFALQLIKMLQEDADLDFLSQVDCFSGTSTGALIVSSFCAGFTPKELLRFCLLFGSRAFLGKKREGKAKYESENLKKILTRFFVKYPTFADVEKDLIIPACALCHPKEKKWHPEVFDNYDREKAKDYSLADIALRSAAAPVYYPSYQQYIDGGLYALNPSMLALASAIDPIKGKRQIEEIRLLSIGTGINPVGIHEEVDWDEFEWMKPHNVLSKNPLFALVTDIAAYIPDYPLTQILRGHYKRVNSPLLMPVDIDDVTKIPVLIKSAKSMRDLYPANWKEIVEWVKTHFKSN